MYWLRYLLKEPFHTLKTAEYRQFLRLCFLYGDKQRFKPTEVQFGDTALSVPDSMSFLWQYKEIFADQSYQFNSENSRPVIVDCGANIGMSLLYYKQQFPGANITAFEASPSIAKLLRKNLERNHITDINLIEKAVWTDDQGIWFANEAADSSSMFLGGDKVLVPSIRLADFLATQSRVDFLKMDIEGAETEVLKDCRYELHKVENIFVEFHSYIGQHQSLASVIQVLEENGFRYHVDTEQHRPSPLINHRYRNNDVMDLQLNIFGYRPKPKQG
ncbi:FkbM family methyltransferase [Dyadobacter jejuensis]|uniref:FkbM family methyltransferase n=1 Tax=Dyadobacter jejuensis TaxID=1082580 RepID=A0A316AT21_9BACT|nr:FkbM family methyltransferase [Dyadobacter jejuensis]PWJ60621.1 FkbM family methyltransferase [Dyadobacter jejuensis]